MAIAAVFRQPLFQDVQTLLQLGDPFFLLRQLFLLHTDLFLLRSDLFLLAPIFCPKLEEFVFCSHDPTLPDFRLFDKSVGDLSSY